MTQAEKIARHLERYGTITALEAMSDYGIMRLASRVSDLKKDGLPIRTEFVRGKNRFGESTWYARYTLSRDCHVTVTEVVTDGD